MLKRKLFYQFSIELIAQGALEQIDYKKVVDEKKDKKTVTKANVNAITRSAGTETGRNYSQNNGAITTGLVKRDKERTQKIIAKYKTRPNMEATKRRCVLGCEDKAHY